MQPMGKLRAIQESEVELMRQWRNTPSIRKNMYTRQEIGETEHLAWWERLKQREDQRYFMYESQGEPLGVVAFVSIDPLSSNASWAFYASPDAPRGTGSRMEFLALDYAFTDLCLHKLYCEVLAFNEAVIRLHEKFGFSVEGVFREHHKVDQAYVDIYRLGILNSEWEQKRQELADKFASY